MTTPVVVKTVIRIVGGATVGALVLAGGYGFASALARTERTDRSTVEAEGLRTVVVRTDVGDVDVRQSSSSGGDVEVSTHRRGSWQLPGIEQRRDGGSLILEALCHDTGWADCSTDVTLRVPRGLAVVVRSDIGDIDVRGEFTDVSVESSAGDVRGERLRAASVTVTTSIGDVDLELAEPVRRVDATSSVGDVTVVVPDDGTEYAVQMRTDTGDRRSDAPQDTASPYSVNASSSVGDVRVMLAPR